MNPQQAKTAKRLVFVAAGAFLLLVALLWIELAAVRQGGQSTISELIWHVWATQPWVILAFSHLIGGPIYYLAGHFTAQSNSVYDALRKEDR